MTTRRSYRHSASVSLRHKWGRPARRQARQGHAARSLRLEALEDRVLLAVGPQLIGITPNVGALLQEGDIRNIAPQEFVFRFDEGQQIDPTSLDGIQITRSGRDGAFDGNDVVIEPGYTGIGDFPNLVVFRFAEALPDDRYQVDIFGSGPTPLQNIDGDPFDGNPNIAGNQDFQLRFTLDLGAQVLAVVPQPVGRDVSGGLTQARDQIVVHFNDDDLDPDSAVDPDFYQLILTHDTATNTDDTVLKPSVVSPPVYDPVANTVVLTFAELPMATGAFRLRVGTAEPLPLPPQQETAAVDPGSSFATAADLLGDFGFSFEPDADQKAKSLIVSAEIVPQPFPLDFPGSNDEPGHRQLSIPSNQHVPDESADSVPGISEFAYNFRSVYARNTTGESLLNQITERQEDRAREIFELYGHYLGVQFYETDGEGFTIVSGDLTAVDPLVNVEVVMSIAGTIPGFGATAIMDASDTWNDQFGGDWFQQAMRRIGQLLGLGGTFDLPEGTIMGSDSRLTFGTGPEPVFPGDQDIVHGQHLYRPDSNDIDLYRFTIPETLGAGLFSAETLAERQVDSSLLDTVLRFYREVDGGRRELVAQNDDYFSNDSFVEMVLEPGIYYVGVSASGNDQYDPTIDDSGFGGLSQGVYDLRMNFRPNVKRSIVDTTGVPLDGNADGVPGGVYNFWFRAQTADNTIFVDKASTGTADGSLARPLSEIDAALAIAAPGDIVRIVGNGGDDDDFATLTDNLPYEIGISSVGSELADGRALIVPRDVTVMVDAGAIFKMRRSAIVVGSSSPAVDRSGAALQVLGIPGQRVYFTSLNDESIGADSTPLVTTPNSGDWGGTILREDVDRGEGRFVYGDEGIFLSTITEADIRYGGGSVVASGVMGVVNPVHIIDARQTVSFSEIGASADAAMSVSPNSFLETNFHSPEFQTVAFTSDYTRIGPDIHGNRLFVETLNGDDEVTRVANTTNGLFIRIPKLADNALQPMTVSGRWDDTDIVHVLAENLILQGTPGGPVEDAATGARTARLNARLMIDPGTIVKAEGARFEAQMGANFYAEGTAERRIVFTSLSDDRYGAGGTFGTNDSEEEANRGDWAGIFLNQTGIGSIDFAVVAYAGGINPLEGSFAGINVVEIHQAEARITHSVFENNADGTGGLAPADRFGRGFNAPATIFVRGAQPVIVDNVFRGNDSPIVNTNVNALNHFGVTDQGRSTGALDRVSSYENNQGPLVRGNRLEDNTINALEVRGGTLTTESVWDDTDIVHVLRDTIYVPNFHTYGGLRLQSSASESLVVKLLGEDAGFTTTGTRLEIPDHIGGRLQVVGQPDRPVVLTSLFDDTVGAGFDPAGQAQTDTNNGGRPDRSEPEGTFKIDLYFGPIILQNPEALAAARRAASLWELQLEDPITVVVDVEMANLAPPIDSLNPMNVLGPNTLMQTTSEMTNLRFDSVRDAMADDARAHEAEVRQLPSLDELNVVLPQDPTNPFTVADDMLLTRANAQALGFSAGSLPGTPSDFDPEGLVIRDAQILINEDPNLWDYQRSDGLETFQEDFVSVFLREIGAALGFTSSVDTVDAALNDTAVPRDILMTPLDLFRFAPGGGSEDFTNAPRLLNPLIPDHVFYVGGSFDANDLGLPIAGLAIGDIPLAKGRELGDELNDWGAGYWLDDVFLRSGKLTEFTPLGVMDPISRWRDQVGQLNDPVQSTLGLLTNISEQDREAFDSIGYDVVGATPGDWQGIRMEQLTHDANAAVVLERETADITAPGINATPENAQFFGALAPDLKAGDDNQRLAFEIHGLLNAPGDVDIYSFTSVAGTEVWLDIDRTSPSLDSVVELIDANGTLFARSDNSHAETGGADSLTGILDPQPFEAFDYYTTNVLDAGMRVVLPGVAGTTNSYLVRVRSSSPDLDGNLLGGLTSGQYQLQVRLQPTDEIPGTSVQFADIRYADTGVRIIGPPTESPLTGEAVEDESFNGNPVEPILPVLDDDGAPVDDTFVEQPLLPYEVSAQNIGNLLASDMGAISVFGNLAASNDVDWYQFDLAYDAVESVPGAFDLGPFSSAGVVFDIDYAAGLGRPNTVLSVFDSLGTLVYYSDQADVADDLPEPGVANGVTDLSRGSVSTLDPYIGPVALSTGAGFFGFGGGTYYVAVSSIAWVPSNIASGAASLDPVVPGVTDRGQSVSGAAFGETFFDFNSAVPPSAVLTGEYQLEIRYVPVPETGFDPSNVTVADKNRTRVQGQLLVDSSTIHDSRQWGIVVEDGLRDMPSYAFDLFEAFGDFDPSDLDVAELSSFYRQFIRQPHAQFSRADYAPHGTPPRALPTLDEERIVPGLTFKNNVIAGGVEGGIHLQGDPGGVIIDTYQINLLTDMFSNFDAGDIDGTEFTIWDHQRNSQTFEFDNSGGVRPGNIPVRFDLNVNNDAALVGDQFRWVNPPTLPEPIAAEIEQAIRFSDLDVKVYRGETGFGLGSGLGFVEPTSLFVEGAIEIGHPDVHIGSFSSVFFPPDSPLPIITAYVAQQGPVPFARIVNNTIVGRGGDLFDASGAGDVAILIEDNASPTILNNIVANFATGVQADLTSTDESIDRRTFIGTSAIDPLSFHVTEVFQSAFSDDFGPFFIGGHGFDAAFLADAPLLQDIDADPTKYLAPRPSIIGATVYQGNLANNRQVGVGDFPIRLLNEDPLFVDGVNGNFLLMEGSRAIDSSVERLGERNRLAAISGAVGIAESDILAPDRDVRGQLRVDDPNVEPPSGFGENVFKDRGALDRVDFVGPTAVLVNPMDNDAAGQDLDPTVTVVRLLGEVLGSFAIQLLDGVSLADPAGGTGADPLTVTRDAIAVTRDGNLLAEGIDYVFGYDMTNDIILLTPGAGIWAPGHAYVITLSSTIRDRAANELKPNQPTGETQFAISLDIESDFGDAPALYPTLQPGAASHIILPGFFLGAGVTAEEDGKPTPAADGDDLDDGITFDTPLVPGATSSLTVTSSTDGLLDAWIDFNGDGDWDDTGDQIFTSEPLTAGANTLLVTTPAGAIEGVSYARFRLSSTGGLTPSGGAADGEVEDYLVMVGTSNPWQNSPEPLDVTDDGFVVPQDSLVIINELNNPQFSDPETGLLPVPPPIPPGLTDEAPFFYDVDGDGFVAPIDALIVINALNRTAATPAQAVVLGAVTALDAQQASLSVGVSRDQVAASLDAPLVSQADLPGRVPPERLPNRAAAAVDQTPPSALRVATSAPVEDPISKPRRNPLTAGNAPTNDRHVSAVRLRGLPGRSGSETTTPELESVLADIAADVSSLWRAENAEDELFQS